MTFAVQDRFLIKQYRDSIEEYLSENSNGSSVQKGNAFTEWILLNLFQLREDEVYEATVIAGKEDNGIDAVFEVNGELCILQTKYNTAHSIDSIHRFVQDCMRLVKHPPNTTREEVLASCVKIRDAFDRNEKINCFYLTNSEIIEWESAQFKAAQAVERKEHPNLSFEILGIYESVERIEINKGLLPSDFRNKNFKMKFQSSLVTEDTFVTNVLLRDLAGFVNKGGNLLFHSNIRNYLRDTAINKGIKSTIENDIQNFWYYNNGITIVCDEWFEQNGDIIMKAPQIVNGCQSARTVGALFKTKQKVELDRQKEGSVLIKIIKTKKSKNDLEKKEFRDNITRFTNSQNAVKGLDFYALDRFQNDLKARFEKIHYYYEIQRGSFVTEEKKKQKSFVGIKEYNYLIEHIRSSKKYVLPAKEVIQSFTAGIKLMPNVAYGRANELTPLGNKWDEIMNDETKELDFEHFLFPYLIWMHSKHSLNYKQGSEGFRKNSSHLFVATYYLLVINIYNKTIDGKIEYPTEIDIDCFKALIKNEELNRILLKRTDKILTNYFRDSMIEKAIDDNLRGFIQNKLKNPSDYWAILNNKVNDMVADIKYDEKEEYLKIQNILLASKVF